MALILLEGLDRTGKSTVAAYYESIGYEIVHLSAPKNISSDDYVQQIADILTSAATRDIVMDRTHYGELIWPQVYARNPILSEDDIDMLREIENSVGVQRVLMYDPNIEAHWKRCTDNNEPLNKLQFNRARGLYATMAHKYQFEMITLPQFINQYPEAKEYANIKPPAPAVPQMETQTAAQMSKQEVNGKTPEQIKLERANVINEVLSKRILKGKGDIYDDIENDIRQFLNDKMGKLLGGGKSEAVSLTAEEVRFFKMMYKKATEKGAN